MSTFSSQASGTVQSVSLQTESGIEELFLISHSEQMVATLIGYISVVKQSQGLFKPVYSYIEENPSHEKVLIVLFKILKFLN